MSQSPFTQQYVAPQPSVPYLKSWGIFYLLETFLATGIGMLVETIFGTETTIAGQDPDTILWLATVGVYLIIFLPISFICYRWSVQKFILPSVGVRPSDM
jgi:hypothetical protein